MIFKSFYLWRHGLLSADKIPTHLTQDEKIALFDMARGLPPGTQCLEIGSYLGASSFFIAQGLRIGSRLICIDTWMNEAMAYTEEEKNNIELQPRNTFAEFRKNTSAVEKKIITLRGSSNKMVAQAAKYCDEIFLMFIDGDHSYSGVKADFQNYKFLLRQGSLIVFHDVGWAEGVNRVIEEDIAHRSRKILEMPNMKGFQLL